MKSHNFVARAALVAAAAFAVTGCDMINSAEAEKGAEAGAGAAAGAAAAPAAPASTLDPLLANPQVGDVWAANLDHFSAAEFGEPGDAEVFGLVRVVDVNPTQVTIITEMSSSPDAASATARLSDYQGSVQWDEQERIPVNRSDFEALVRDQRIVRPTRPAGAAAAPAAPAAPAGPAAPAAPAPAAPGGGK